MNREFTREKIQEILQRWQQLKQQFGDQAVNVPEFAQLSKIIKFIQQNQSQQRQQRQQVATVDSGGIPNRQHQPDGSSIPSANGQNAMRDNGVVQPNPVGGIGAGNYNQMSHPPANQPNFNNNPNPNPNPMNMNQNKVGQNLNNNGAPITNGNMNGGMPNDSSPINSAESAFTAQQFQLVKSQFQAFKFLLRNSSPGNQPIPQNLVDFVSNDRSAFPSGGYLPSVNAQSQVQKNPQIQQQQQLPQQQVQPQQNIQQQQPVAQPQGLPLQNKPVEANTPLSIGTPELKKFQRPPTKFSPVIPSGAPQSTTKPESDLASKLKGIKPILLDAKPPSQLKDLVVEESEKMVIPISRPNVQVDCFELPQYFTDKDIPFNKVYEPQSRLQYPSLLPNGISVEEIFQNRELLMVLQIEQQIDNLKSKIETEKDESQREQLSIELAKLQLLPYQKQLKGSILSQVWFSRSILPNSHPNFLAKFSTLSLENVSQSHDLFRHQMLTLLQVQNQKHQTTINEILITRDNQTTALNKRRDRLARFATKVNSLHNQIAKEEQKRIERMAKQRLQALKSNDEEAYLKLLDHTKDTRITHLLKQTNQFLDSLAQAVQTQQKEANHRSGKTNDAELETMDADEKREKLDYYEVAHRIKEEVLKQPSILVGGTLKEYQIKGLQWMVSLFNNHLNGILADEMGLGKTIQTISLLTYLVEVKRINGPFLVIVPLSTLTNWNLEFDKWAPALKKITYKGTPNQRKLLQQEIRSGNFQVLLTTFEYIIKDKALLSRLKWVHMIIDEGHRMKNSNSKLSETLTHNYHSDYRLILTGTPLQNNLPELWALLNFVLPKIFNSVKSFDEWFNTPFANTGGQDKIELTEEETLLVIRRLHKVLRPFLLRRLKKDVEKDLPNKVEKVVKCKMSSLQSKLYQQMLRYNILYASDPADGATPLIIKNANNQIMQLRKICNHPFVYEEVENLINPAVENNDQIWRVAGKFELLDKVLPKFKATGHRVLIFFQMTQIMDIMEDFLRYRNLKYMRLDGGTKADDRTGLLKLFNAPDSEYFCFLLSTRAGGLGLNLQTADTVIIFDTDWNPHQDLQAQDRAHRIGQKNEVRILRLITEDSVEEMILERAHAKLEIDGKVIQAGKFDQKSTAEEQEAMLRALFEKEDERRSKGSTDEEDDMDDDELNQVIARNDDELAVFRKMDEDRIIATRNAPYPSRLYSEQELPEVYKKDPGEVIKKDEIKVEEYGRGSRERKVMKYDDNLSEEQWLRKIDGFVSGDESDSDVELRPKRNKGRPRAKRATDFNSEISSKADSPSEYGDGKRSYSDYLGGDSPEAGSLSKRQRANTPRGGSKGRSNARGRGTGRGRGNLAYRATPTVDPLTSEERSKLQTVLENILDCIISYRNDEGRLLSDIFMVKPPKRLYPDYYVLIKHPIALDTIKKRVSSKIYATERELLEDTHLMFSNARIYNEEGSVVYEDAKTLEQLAISKFKELTDLPNEAVEKTLDFKEFDETFSLKPLVVGNAVKHPVEEPKLDMDAFDLPDFPLDLETGDSTPATFE